MTLTVTCILPFQTEQASPHTKADFSCTLFFPDLGKIVREVERFFFSSRNVSQWSDLNFLEEKIETCCGLTTPFKKWFIIQNIFQNIQNFTYYISVQDICNISVIFQNIPLKYIECYLSWTIIPLEVKLSIIFWLFIFYISFRNMNLLETHILFLKNVFYLSDYLNNPL